MIKTPSILIHCKDRDQTTNLALFDDDDALKK